MKKLVYSILILPWLFSCSSVDKKAEQNIAIVENYVQSVQNLDYGTMESLLHEDYLGMGPSYGDSINKETAVANWEYLVDNLYESISYSRSRNVAVTINSGDNQGEWVSNWAELYIEYQNGGEVTIWANTIYKIENMQIVKSYTFYNEADALRQLGYIFYNPNVL